MLGQGVEGDVGARSLSVVVGATELSAGGREATTGSGGGQAGTDGGGGVHLGRCKLAAVTDEVVGISITHLVVQRGGNERSELDGRSQDGHRKVAEWDDHGHMILVTCLLSSYRYGPIRGQEF